MNFELSTEERGRIIALAEQIQTARKLAAELPAATPSGTRHGVYGCLEDALVQTLALAIPAPPRSRESRARWVYALVVDGTGVAEALERESVIYEQQMSDLMEMLRPTRDAANRADDPGNSDR
jgi:hypothetical protein